MRLEKSRIEERKHPRDIRKHPRDISIKLCGRIGQATSSPSPRPLDANPTDVEHVEAFVHESFLVCAATKRAWTCRTFLSMQNKEDAHIGKVVCKSGCRSGVGGSVKPHRVPLPGLSTRTRPTSSTSRLSSTSRFWSALLRNAHGCAGRSCQCRTRRMHISGRLFARAGVAQG